MEIELSTEAELYLEQIIANQARQERLLQTIYDHLHQIRETVVNSKRAAKAKQQPQRGSKGTR